MHFIFKVMISQNKAFSASLKIHFNSFSPETGRYKEQIYPIAFVFLIFAGVILFLTLCYMLLRLVFKKCVGPIKASQVTKGYRNISWILLVGALASLVTVYSILL